MAFSIQITLFHRFVVDVFVFANAIVLHPLSAAVRRFCFLLLLLSCQHSNWKHKHCSGKKMATEEEMRT